MNTPEKITHLLPNEVFVFGSNLAGRHGLGAALTAVRKFGARHGKGMGLCGQSYAIATKDRNLRVLSLAAIETQVIRFLEFAEENPNLTFYVTKIGCGLARYSVKDIAPMFNREIPANVILPIGFQKK